MKIGARAETYALNHIFGTVYYGENLRTCHHPKSGSLYELSEPESDAFFRSLGLLQLSSFAR